MLILMSVGGGIPKKVQSYRKILWITCRNADTISWVQGPLSNTWIRNKRKDTGIHSVHNIVQFSIREKSHGRFRNRILKILVTPEPGCQLMLTLHEPQSSFASKSAFQNLAFNTIKKIFFISFILSTFGVCGVSYNHMVTKPACLCRNLLHKTNNIGSETHACSVITEQTAHHLLKKWGISLYLSVKP